MNSSRNPVYRARALEKAVLEASKQYPVVLLTGPRQVGKTSLLEHLHEKGRRYVTLDDLNVRALARKDPMIFLQQFPPPLTIDEIQYAPELFSVIKLHVDTHSEPGAFWLTGSQSFPLMKGVTESLAGRVAVLNLLGFSSREADERSTDVPPFLPTPEALKSREKSSGSSSLRDVYTRIWLGSYPALVAGKVHDRDLYYRSYVETYLQRDVRDLVNVGDLIQFSAFLKAVAARTGRLLNYTDLARDCSISVNTARNWMAVLQASHQVFLLPAWHANVSKRLYSTPKLYMTDTGLCAYLTEWSSPETLASGAMSGAIFETYVFGEILKSWWYRGKNPTLYHYRDKDKREIDLLIACDGRLYPVEIKKSATMRAEDGAAFRVLEKSGAVRGEAAIVGLYPQKMALSGDVTCVPVGMI